ncbi:YdgH/BhsA/McbA-like domain containing protein [Erwiniaceae bacterium CAU 1747]
MKSIKTFAALIALSAISFGSFAQTVTATGPTLDSAEAKIAAKAEQAGTAYRIIEATSNNGVHMTAQLIK